MPAQLTGASGALRVPVFAGGLVVFAGLCIGLASIGGWPGVLAAAAAILAAAVGIVATASAGRPDSSGHAGPADRADAR